MDFKSIGTERQFKDALGVSRVEFADLLSSFEAQYLDEVGETYEEYIRNNVVKEPTLGTLEECLCFTLFQMKNDLVYGALGAVFGMSHGSASRYFQKYSGLLERALVKKK